MYLLRLLRYCYVVFVADVLGVVCTVFRASVDI